MLFRSLAKSAVCSAVETLAIRRGVGWDQIDKAAISGGFSAGIDIGNAVGTGLLPAGLREKCVPVNNSSLLGTAKYACEKNDLSVYLDRMRYVDLASDPTFSSRFIENMAF